MGCAITTISSNLTEMSKGVKLLSALMDDGVGSGHKLMGAARMLAGAVSDLLRSVEPAAAEVSRSPIMALRNRISRCSVNYEDTGSPFLSVFRLIVFIRRKCACVSAGQSGVINMLLTSSYAVDSRDRQCSRQRGASDRPAGICSVTSGRARSTRSSRFAATHSAFLWHRSPNRKTHTDSQCSLEKKKKEKTHVIVSGFIIRL